MRLANSGTSQVIVEPANGRSVASGGTAKRRLLGSGCARVLPSAPSRTANKRPLTWPPFLFPVLALALFAVPAFAQSPIPASAPAKYELPAIPDEFKDADAIILSWNQKWTVAGDSSITQHEKKRVLINNDRAIGAFADPRITYNKDWQTIKVLVARTITPDGRVMDVPEYSRNTVAPGESAGWPAFAAIQQLVLTFSAIEPGAILELEWERVTKPGMKRDAAIKPSLQIAERIAVDYPTLSRTIVIAGSAGAWNTNKSWKNIPSDRDEAQSIPATERVEHFCFSSDTMSSYDPAQAARLDALKLSFGTGSKKRIATEISKWTAGKLDAMAKAREIHSQFYKAFNLVPAYDEFVADPIRSLDDIYSSRYGSHREATALLLALFREAGLLVEPYLIVTQLGKGTEVQPSIMNYGVILDSEPMPTFWTAAQGRIREPLSSRNQMIVTDQSSPAVTKCVNATKFGDDLSTISLTGSITLSDDFKWTGQVDVACTGVFTDSPACATDDGRKEFVRSIVDRVLPKCIVESTSITSLSDENARISAKIKTNDALPAADGHRLLQLAAHGPHGRSIGIPLSSSLRRTDLRIASRFDETIALSIELPKDTTLVSMPRDIENKGAWGSVKQSTSKPESGRLSFQRHVSVNKRDVPAADYPSLREALSDIQTDSARMFAWKSPKDAAQKVN